MTHRLAESLRMGGALARNTWITRKPFLVYLKPTAHCDLRCRICNRWHNPGPRSEEMDLDAIRGILEVLRGEGAGILTLWGGEPTLRSDLGDILRTGKELGYRTAMCTNANTLARQADAIVPWLDTLLCSLDGIGERHDEIRGVRGLFNRVVEGIRAARRHDGKRIKIWASLHRENLDDIEPLAALAADLGIWIEYFPVAPIAGYNESLVLDAEGLRLAFDRVAAIKRAGLPVWNSAAVLRKMGSGRMVRCNMGRMAIHIDHRGEVHSCEDPEGTPLHPWGRSSAELDLRTLFRSAEFRRAGADLAECTRCRLPCVFELGDNLLVAYATMFGQALTRR